AHLLQVRTEQGGLAGTIALAPYVHALWSHVYIDPHEVPIEHAANRLRRVETLGSGKLREALARIALPVLHEVAVVDRGRALDQHRARIIDPRPGRVREEQRDLRIALRISGLLGMAEPRCHVDRAVARAVVRRHRA